MNGFEIALTTLTTTPAIPVAMLGVAWGIVGGALPGISASITMALLLPFTFGMDPTLAMIMLASTYVGAEYGGSIPAILIRTPGTSAAVTTAIEGYQMHRQGRGDEALGISLACGTVGGLIGMILLVALMEPLTHISLLFSTPAYFALGIFGISVLSSLSEGSVVKGFLAALIGIGISTIGLDPLSGLSRYTFNNVHLLSGIEPILVMIGVFAVTEMLTQVGEADWDKTASKMRIKLPSLKMWKRLWLPTSLGSGVGAVEGVIPGAGATVASFLSYNEARRWSKYPEEFGKGSPEGVAAPEAANNTVAATALVPTLAFGIPGSGSMAVLLGGLILHGMEPGPLLIEKNPVFVYGLFSGLFVANISQLVLGYIMLPPCIWLVNQHKGYLTAGVFALVFSGIYSINSSVFDLIVVLAAGGIGYLMRLCGFPLLPMVLGLVLGSMIERNYRRSVELSYGDNSIFFQDTTAAVLICLAILFFVGSTVSEIRKNRRARQSTAETVTPSHSQAR